MILIVQGRSMFGTTAEEDMADMLRYDSGTVLYVLEEGRNFLAVVHTERYTEERWRSFLFSTRQAWHPFDLPEKMPIVGFPECADCGRPGGMCPEGCN